MSNIKEFNLSVGMYRSGVFQSTGGKWYGKVNEDGKMDFISQNEFEAGIALEEVKRPTLQSIPF